jgi:hypothetical protein
MFRVRLQAAVVAEHEPLQGYSQFKIQRTWPCGTVAVHGQACELTEQTL